MRRAVVLFIEDVPHLIDQAWCLYTSWKHVQCEDTDLVFFGTSSALRRMPDGVIKIPQRPATDDSRWLNYGYVNSVACLNGPGSACLDEYDFLLRSDLDVFLTSAWNQFKPSSFVSGQGGYNEVEVVRENVQRIADELGFCHRGVFNIGSTIYGPAPLVKEICELTTALCFYIRTEEFKHHEGTWPSWYAGVSLMYAQEIAVNHLVPEFDRPSALLDYPSNSMEHVNDHPHIHCWHTDELFSKFRFGNGKYDHYRSKKLNPDIVREYCLAMALQSRTRAA